MYAARFQIPNVLTLHTQYERYSYYVPAIPHNITSEAIRRIVFSLADKVDIITTPSQSMKELINRYGITKEIVVIPNAIDIDIFRNKNKEQGEILKKELRLAPDEIVILYVGRVSIEKDIDKIIKALAIIRDQNNTNFQFIVVGEGTALEQMKDLADSLNLADKVKFTGAVSRELIKYYYQIADIFAFSSTSETFGIVIIEALASGLPILAVKAPGAVDIITDGFNGILAENDIANFAEHLSVLIQDKGLRQRLSKNAQQTAKKYCIDTVADRVLELYERLIADN